MNFASYTAAVVKLSDPSCTNLTVETRMTARLHWREREPGEEDDDGDEQRPLG